MAKSTSTLVVKLKSDTGKSSTDWLTRDGTLAVTPVSTGDKLVFRMSSDGGLTWGSWTTTTGTIASAGTDGLWMVQVQELSKSGAVLYSASVSYTLDRVALAPGVALASDTGLAGDRITSNGTLALSGVESGASVQYSINGGSTWTSSFTAKEGANAVSVRQTDAAGNVSAATSFSFTLDTTKAAAPGLALVADTGISASDGLTSNGAVATTGVEAGATVQYSTDGGTTWSAGFTAKTGLNQVLARQLDVAGNASSASTLLSFTLDTSAAAPTLALVADTGSLGSDKITSNGNLSVGGTEAGAAVQYSIDGGITWSSSFAATEGLNQVVARQIDKAGNVSAASAALSFTLDTQAAALTVALAHDTGSSGTDALTSDASLAIGSQESGAVLRYSIDGGNNWGSSFAAVEGFNDVWVRQVDAAGNSSEPVQLTFTLDSAAPTAVDDDAYTTMDNAVIVSLLANDSDTSGVSLAGHSGAAHGTVTDNGDGTVTYTPDAGYTGADYFTYTVADGAGLESVAKAQVFVSDASGGSGSGNLAPQVWAPIGIWVAGNAQPVTVDALQNAYDPEGQALLVTNLPASLPAGVSFDVATQSFVFDPSLATAASVVVNFGITDNTSTTPTSITFQTGSSPFVALDPASTAAGVLTSHLLAANSGIVVDASSVVWHASGASSTNLYDGSLAALGIGSGLLLTSGTTPAPMNTVTWFGTDNGGDWTLPSYNNGDPLLDAVVNTVFSTSSYDATMLSFSFSVSDPNAQSVSFDLVFGSDEYPEWVDQFVDVAVVVINGVNYALFNHDPMHPLSVIGSNLANSYFMDNADGHLPIEYDGLSHKLTILAPVQAGTNTITIGIGDTGDHIYDSGVFLANLKASNLPGDGLLIQDDHGSDASDLIVLPDGGSNDTASGGASDDVIVGNSGNNTISGGSGSDQLQGGAGADEFDYTDRGDWAQDGLDTITDFSGNTLAVSNAPDTNGINGDVLLFSYATLAGVAGAQMAGFVHPDAGHLSSLGADFLAVGAATQAHAQFVYNDSTGLLSFDPDGTDAAQAVDVTLIGNHAALEASAILIVG